MKRSLSALVLALAMVSQNLPVAEAYYGIEYCSDFQNPSCLSEEGDLGSFLTILQEEVGYYAASNFNLSYSTDAYAFDYADDGYVAFETAHFEYYIPFYVYETFFEEADYSSSYFTSADWEQYDQDQDLLMDNFENYTENFEDFYGKFTGTYDLDLWWSSAEKLPVVFDYDQPGAYGFFTWYNNGALPFDGPYLSVNSFEEEDAVVGTIAHEMFHAIQYGYVDDMSILASSSFAEGSATMIESKINGNNDLSYMQLEDIAALENPELSVFGAINDWNDSDKYGSFLWYSYLHQYYGKDIVKGILEAFSELESEYGFDESYEAYYSYLAVSQALEEQGEDIADVFGEFAIKNFDQDDYTDGEYLPEVSMLNSHTSSSGEVSVDDGAPALFGSNYIEFVTEGDEGYLNIEFLGNSDALFYISFIPTGKDGSADREATERYYVDYGDSASFYIALDDYDEVVMVISPVDVSVIDTTDPFNDYIYPYTYSYDHADELPADYDPIVEEGEPIFTDVDSSDDNSAAISYLKENGIVDGYDDGSFKPENPLNRAELLKILVEGMGYSPDENTYKNCFPDVTTDWYAKYVCYAKEQGWIEGYPDGTFLPASDVNKVEAVKMLLEVFGVESAEVTTSPYSDVSIGEWYARYIVKAEELGLLEETGTYSPGSSITRGGVSENIYRLLLQL